MEQGDMYSEDEWATAPMLDVEVEIDSDPITQVFVNQPERCKGTWNPGVYPFITRCVKNADHPGECESLIETDTSPWKASS